jgi:hypothetical protein
MNVFDKAPVVEKDAFVAPSASITGNVHVGRSSSIWYGCVLRGKMDNLFFALHFLSITIEIPPPFPSLFHFSLIFDYVVFRYNDSKLEVIASFRRVLTT